MTELNRNQAGDILVVDDNRNNLKIVRSFLQDEGYNVRCVTSGAEAISVAGKRPPELMILDIRMPEMDGYEVCRRLKSEKNSKDIPIIFISALSEALDKVQAFKAGGVDYLTKPFQQEEVLARVQTHLYIRQMQKQLETQNIGLKEEIERRKAAEKWLKRLNEELEESAGLSAAELIKTNKKLKESEARLSEAQRMAQIGNWELDLQTNELYWSDEVFRIFDIEPSVSGASYETFLNAIHEDDRESVNKAYRESVKAKIPYNIDHRLMMKDKRIKFVNERCETFYDDQGGPVRSIGTIQDITEQKKVEGELKKAFTEIELLKDRLHNENIYLRKEINLQYKHDLIDGKSHTIKQMLILCEQVATTDSTVLLMGETGTGKELAARTIHNLSPRKDTPMITVNCAALPATLIESELFGCEKGAYTGALSRQIGRFELANGSTLLLDEISELPLELQSKLLRVLQEGEIIRLGSSETIKVDVRVIATTNRDLAKEVIENRFRNDLFYRINVFPITIPPLRDRKGDIPLLVSAFIEEFENTMGKKISTIPKKIMEKLQNYPWPGNVRELRNMIERAMIISQNNIFHIEFPTLSIGPEKLGIPSETKLEDVEKNHIIAILKKTEWRVKGPGGAAEILDLKPTTLYSRIKKLGIERPS